MAVKENTAAEIDALIGVNHAKTGGLVVPRGSQNYDTLVNNALLRAYDASAGFLQVFADDSAGTTARVLAGRALINGVVLVYAGGTVDLTAFNNDTAYVWLQNNGSDVAQVSSAADGTGWPAGNHIKLAEVTLASGVITAIVDRRPDTLLSDGSATPGTTKSAFTVGLGSSTARLVIDNNSATGNFTQKLVPANLSANRTLTLPDETGTLATQDYVDTATPDLSTVENAIAAIEDELFYFSMEITTQGDTSTPSVVTISRLDFAGAVVTGYWAARFRICDFTTSSHAANANAVISTGDTLLETITADKDLVVATSGPGGTISITITNATAEGMYLRMGPPLLGALRADYSALQHVVHAAP